MPSQPQSHVDVPELIIAPATRGADGDVTRLDGPEPDSRLRRVIRGSHLRSAAALLRRGAAALSSKAIVAPAKAAEQLFREALEQLGPAVDTPHPMVAYALDRVGLACQLQGKHDEAQGLYLRSLALQQAGRWPPTPWTEVTLLNLAVLYGRQGKVEVREALLRRVSELQREPWLVTVPDSVSADAARPADGLHEPRPRVPR